MAGQKNNFYLFFKKDIQLKRNRLLNVRQLSSLSGEKKTQKLESERRWTKQEIC
jgi:hypothetical protein